MPDRWLGWGTQLIHGISEQLDDRFKISLNREISNFTGLDKDREKISCTEMSKEQLLRHPLCSATLHYKS